MEPKSADKLLTEAIEKPVIVHVLFMDIVDSTRETADHQKRINDELQKIVSSTSAFNQARAKDELISLPTGDGMALVFRDDFEAPPRCAIEIARALKSKPVCRLRTGIHSGPVYIGPDINGMPNVSGEGIGFAARVMSCGGEGHILLSGRVAESLRNLTAWKDKLRYLGEFRAKKDRVPVWSLVDGEIGSTAILKAPRWQKPIGRRVFLSSAGVLAAVIAGIIGAREFRGPVGTVQERSFSYAVFIKDPQGRPEKIQPDAFLTKGAQIMLSFSTLQSGYLYVVAESPIADGGRSWSWLFPEPGYHKGSSHVSEELHIPTTGQYLEVTGGPNADTVHMIWSETLDERLETVKTQVFLNAGDLSASNAAVLSDVIRQSAKAVVQQRGMDMFVRSHGSTVATSFTLGHR